MVPLRMVAPPRPGSSSFCVILRAPAACTPAVSLMTRLARAITTEIATIGRVARIGEMPPALSATTSYQRAAWPRAMNAAANVANGIR